MSALHRRTPGAAPVTAQRILVVLRDFRLGGTERVAVRLANMWSARGREVVILTASQQGELRELVAPDVRMALVDTGGRAAGDLRIPLKRSLPGFLLKHRFDVAFLPGNAHWPIARALSAMPPAARPKVIAQASNPLNRRDKGPIAGLLRRARLKRDLRGADAAIGLHPEMTRDLVAVMGRAAAVTVPNPALDDRTPPPRPADPRGRRIVVIGRLEPQKNLALALEAFARLGDPAASLCFLGEGSERRKLEHLATKLGVRAQVEFAGTVPDPRPWLDEARLLLISSHYEGFPAVLVEALAAGRPIVTTAWWDGLHDLLEASGAGRVAPLNDAQALAAAIRRTFDTAPPDAEALARSANAYRIGPIADAYLRLFDACCAGLSLTGLDHEPNGDGAGPGPSRTKTPPELALATERP